MTDLPLPRTLVAEPPLGDATHADASARAAHARDAARAGAAHAMHTAGMLWSRYAAPVVGILLRPFRAVTALGWVVIAAAAVAVTAGLAFDWGELLAVAALGAAVLILSVPFIVGRSAFRVRVELASPRVVVGEPAVGRVIVRNAAKRASSSVRIELPVGTARAEFRMPRLAADAEHDELFTIPTQHRAVLQLGPVTSVRTDPVGVLRRAVRWTEPTELYVHPRVVRLPSESTGFLRDLEGLPTRDLADDDVSFHTLRDYSPGDDLRHVHWKSTARTQQLMIRQFEQTRRSHLVIALATREADYTDADEFELAVSFAGSLGLGALREGKALTLLVDGEVSKPSTPGRLLDRLSAVDLSADAAGVVALEQSVARSVPSASVVAFVTGAVATPGEIRAASVRVPVTARSMCLRAATGEQLSRRTLGGLVLLAVPTLENLRTAMRAAAA